MSEENDRTIHVVNPDANAAAWLQSHLADTDVEVLHFASAEDYGNDRPLPWLLIANGDSAGCRRLCDRFQKSGTSGTGGVVLTSGSTAVPELLDHGFLSTAADLYVRMPLATSRFTHHLQALLEARMAARIAAREAELAERETQAAL